MKHSQTLSNYYLTEKLKKKNENSTVALGNVFEKLRKWVQFHGKVGGGKGIKNGKCKYQSTVSIFLLNRQCSL